MKRNIGAIVGLLVLLAIGITVCTFLSTTRKQESEFGLFGEGNSIPPCWWKICAGQTYEPVYLLSVLESDPRISSITEDKHTVSVSFTIRDATNNKTIRVDLPLYGEMVIGLLTPPSYQITIGQLIDKFGFPDYISAELYPSSLGIYELYYPSKGMMILSKSFLIGDIFPVLTKDILISSITIIRRIDLERIMASGKVEIWHGYERYSPLR